MTPFYIATGFLGSGKTTWLKRILAECADDMKIGVIQNEFAPGNIDGTDLKHSGKPFKMLEINNGSVFCVCLLSDFISSLHAFVEQEKPDCVILEASGLADPISIGEMLHAPALADMHLEHVWTIVDAGTFLQMEPRLTRITHQVRVADTVIINKTDLVADIAPLEARIRQLNPYAAIEHASYCEIPAKRFMETLNGTSQAMQHPEELENCEPGGRPDVNSVVLRISGKIDPRQLELFLDKYKSQTYRMKGYIVCTDGKVRAVQSTYGSAETRVVEDYHGTTELIAMGDDIDPKDMRNDLLAS